MGLRSARIRSKGGGEMMPGVAFVVPALSLLIFVVLCVLPWGVSEHLRFVAPLLPFTVVYHWARSAMPLPTSIVFLAGFLVDVLTYGPLGYWSLIYLVGMALASGAEWALGRGSRLAYWRDFVLVATLLAVAAWLVASAYFITPIEWLPLALAVAVVCGLYPLVVGLLQPFERMLRGPKPLNLHRKS